MEKPKIRFKGYQEDWEQRKLSNCAGFRRGSFPQPYGNKDWYDGEGAMPFVQVADVSDDMKLVDDTKQKISKLAQPMSVCAEEGSVLVTLQGSIGRVAITQYKAFVDRTVLIFDKYNADIDKTFWAYIIKEKFIEEARKAPGGTIKTITKEVLSDFDLMLPSYDEQKMLGKLLHSLDDLITLHQRKCEEMKTLKKYMLQKMFPQNGQSVPQIRFSGFTEDWEQRKLNEIAAKVSEKNKNNEFSEPFTNSAEQGIISQKDYFDREIVNNENLNGYYIVRNDDFIYNPRISVTAPVGPINRNRLGRNGVMSPLYTVFRTHDIDNLYLEFYFKTTKWHRFMKLNGDSGARFDRFTISSTQFMEMPIPYPTLEEQQKIGEYFDSLDHLITLHQQKCDELRNIKKFMLQNMFI